MTPAEYKSLPANLQRDVRVALACGWKLRQILRWPWPDGMLTVTYPAEPNTVGQVWSYRVWQPTTDTTIWTALMLVRTARGYQMYLDPWGHAGTWIAGYYQSPCADAATQGEAVCACFVAADPLGHLGRAGV